MIAAHKITEALRTVSVQDRTIGYLRYEALSKLSYGQIQHLYMEAINGTKSFDSLVDELIEKEGLNPGPK